jgi:hypothetical protein
LAREIATCNTNKFRLFLLLYNGQSNSHLELIGEKLRLYAICQAYCYNSYCFLKSLPSLGFDYFYLMATAGDRLRLWGDRLLDKAIACLDALVRTSHKEKKSINGQKNQQKLKSPLRNRVEKMGGAKNEKKSRPRQEKTSSLDVQ